MNVGRLAVAASSLTLAVAAGGVLLGAPTAHAEECTGLLECTTENVGDTVREVGEGDLDGTVDRTGKTVGDAVDGVRKTVGGDSPGGTDTPPSSGDSGDTGGGSAGEDDAAAGGSSGGHDSPGDRRRAEREPRAHRSAHDDDTATVGTQDTSTWVSLRQWQSRRLPVDGALGPSAATAPRDREVPPPEVAEPPVTAGAERPHEKGPATLHAVPAAEAASAEAASAEPRPLPAAVVFTATLLAGTAGVAVLGVYQRRRRSR